MSPKRDRKALRGALIGMVLGDGCLHQNRFRDGSYRGNYLLSITHSTKQVEYLEHKRQIVNQIFDYEIPLATIRVRSTNGKQYPAIKMATRTHARFKFIARRLYTPEREKRITEWALENITREGLALWWMDDGCLHIDKRPDHGGGFIVWGLYGFPLVDIERLQRWLLDTLDVSLRIGQHKKTGGYYLRRGLSEGRKLLDVLLPWAHESMRYKFDWSHAYQRGPYCVSQELSTVPTPSLRG